MQIVQRRRHDIVGRIKEVDAAILEARDPLRLEYVSP